MPPLRALSIRQPYAELILRGIKTAELRSRGTRVVGERFYIYASKGSGVRGQGSAKAWSGDLEAGRPPAWMIELAGQVGMIEPDAVLPTGVIVGSAVIERVSQADSIYRWHLTDVRRARTLRKPGGRPRPVWFEPF